MCIGGKSWVLHCEYENRVAVCYIVRHQTCIWLTEIKLCSRNQAASPQKNPPSNMSCPMRCFLKQQWTRKLLLFPVYTPNFTTMFDQGELRCSLSSHFLPPSPGYLSNPTKQPPPGLIRFCGIIDFCDCRANHVRGRVQAGQWWS